MAARTRKPDHDQATKDAIKGSQLINFLTDQALGKKELSDSLSLKIAAARAALPFLRPALQSIEQTNHEASRSAEDIIKDIQALIFAKPELMLTLLPGYRLVPVDVSPATDVLETPATDVLETPDTNTPTTH